MLAEGFPSFFGERIPGRWLTSDEFLADLQVFGVLQFSELGAKISIGGVEEFLEAAEGNGVGVHEHHAGGKTVFVLQQGIELREDAIINGRLFGVFSAHGSRFGKEGRSL